ncbi:MAG: class I SAM-dependent methyltransferase [Sphingopyxis granuli]|uniref:class I SAM-dependent methyltransferase n=1 Tax=Sphingopyxis TaxID=165697 RepID=UPI00086C76AA|nr:MULTISPECIES: class I SAM-dependent methyltransferase [unclassified Sphingopyxis]AVA14463.1 methyltransferase [Sphingopyxis sp. MG]ODU29065.1 MAG: methyltransferase [Sphingopyxis sp. SCN 67-31]
MIRPLTLGLLLAVAVPPVAAKQAPSPDYKAALADPARPAADRERDAARKPTELLAFAGVKPGQTVGDFVMGGGYLTRILAGAVGPEGKVYAFQPAEFIAFKKQYGDDQAAIDAAYANVDAIAGPFAAPAFPVPLDTIVTVQNFHDLYLKPFPEGIGDKASAALFAALKPGGTLVVIDHSAADGSGTTLSDSLHRIDKAAVVAALTKAGFQLEAESDLYKRPDDPRTANVFDPSIRGKTDQFMLRFKKPV